MTHKNKTFVTAKELVNSIENEGLRLFSDIKASGIPSSVAPIGDDSFLDSCGNYTNCL
ncbi:hypothetical protein [Paramaledivibacter caminithermalis]|jgi:hypothetical protein|uniref:Uncharacterized protein n=1 Tax=Paramaledivibacter caminithermalis (strain DSM 15212 / CIP 107654 / DViRD3) TaxID=1121301 RepID=A0A1M6R069_PARC5|nr:hypothetical protein [Paramaledivibacter caminithermalis]SHK25919.1 hypothetical protein SAMN02745912_02801 [Paramaledivibacter caminithermalis DSM 15212]